MVTTRTLHRLAIFFVFVVVQSLTFSSNGFGGTTSVPSLLGFTPARNTTNSLPTVHIKVWFNFGVYGPSFNDSLSFVVTGAVSGKHHGTIVLTGATGDTVTFSPTTPFFAGEHVIVTLSNSVVYQGYQFEFWVKTTTGGTGTSP